MKNVLVYQLYHSTILNLILNFHVVADRQQFGAKSIKAHAQQYKDLAARHPYNFEPPQTWFVFCNDVPSNVGKALEEIGVRAISLEDLSTSQPSRTMSLHHATSSDCSSEVGFVKSNTGLRLNHSTR